MGFAIKPSLPPMEARLVDEIPTGDEWQYEPKWDGFRCLVFRDDRKVVLQSKSGQPLGRYFPEIVAAVSKLKAKRLVLDGELVLPVGEQLVFDELLQRIHPAASRVKRLSTEHPALFIVFDLMADERGHSLLERPFQERRRSLEAFAKKNFVPGNLLRLSPATRDLATAKRWFRRVGGIVAKRVDMPYHSGDRLAMQKIKVHKTADCVIGGFRYASRGKIVGSLLLGLYDDAGLLHHVGFTSGLSKLQRRELTPKLERLIKPPGFTGRAPGAPSRWSNARSTAWQPLKPKLVIAVAFDHVSGNRLRHGTKFVRWRPDKAPRQCTFDQIVSRSTASLHLLTTAS